MAMIMKRKRSDSELSFYNSSSPQSNAMDIDMCMSPINAYQSYREITPSHLPSRTRKRLRDNRPSESSIHSTLPIAVDCSLSAHPLTETENTLSMLYSAQKQAQIEPIPSNVTTTTCTDMTPIDPTRQKSLHSFWNLPSQNSSETSTPSPPPVNIRMQTNCEDCNGNLFITNEDSAMDIDFDLCDASIDSGCSACGKQVCNHCSISPLGAQRQCLICAGKRRWVGGLGWVDS